MAGALEIASSRQFMPRAASSELAARLSFNAAAIAIRWLENPTLVFHKVKLRLRLRAAASSHVIVPPSKRVSCCPRCECDWLAPQGLPLAADIRSTCGSLFFALCAF